MNRKEKIISGSSHVFAYNHRTTKIRNMTAYDGVRTLLATNSKSQELFSSYKLDSTVRLNSNGSVVGGCLSPNNLVSSSDNSVPDLERNPSTVSDDEKLDYNCVDGLEELDDWWKNDSEDSEEEDDLDLTLVLEEDNEAECLEATQLPDVIQATQLPPEKISGFLKNKPVESEIVEADSTVCLEEEKIRKDSGEEEEPWMECWNCRAPKPIPGIFREDADCLRIIFCCDKPTRIKPTNDVIESSAKSYPYDSWVHHSFS